MRLQTRLQIVNSGSYFFIPIKHNGQPANDSSYPLMKIVAKGIQTSIHVYSYIIHFYVLVPFDFMS